MTESCGTLMQSSDLESLIPNKYSGIIEFRRSFDKTVISLKSFLRMAKCKTCFGVDLDDLFDLTTKVDKNHREFKNILFRSICGELFLDSDNLILFFDLLKNEFGDSQFLLDFIGDVLPLVINQMKIKPMTKDLRIRPTEEDLRLFY